MLLSEKSRDIHKITLNGDNFEVVKSYRYLGHILTHNLSEDLDADLRLKAFNIKFLSLRRKFCRLPNEIFLYLFKSYCLPNYGLNIWNTAEILDKKEFKAFEIGHSNALNIFMVSLNIAARILYLMRVTC